jgi:hypothetical protein
VTTSATTNHDSPEWSLLLAASSFDLPGQHLQNLLQRPVDWEVVLRLAERHGTLSLLWQTLAPFAPVVPAAVLKSLTQAYERNVHKTLFLARELIRILDCIDALGIVAIPYKGVVLSEIYYGDMALRHSGDMDLFVRAEEVDRIKSAVRDLGYTLPVPIPELATADYLASGYECAFDSVAGKNLLEVQWSLQPRFYAVDFDMEGLFGRAVSVSLAGRKVKTPSSEDLLLVLSLHAAKHVWGRLIWLCDIARILRRDELNWDWIQSQARELGVERILHITLQLGNRLLGMRIPAAMEAAVAGDRAAFQWAEKIAVSICTGVVYEEEKMSYFRLMMQLRERRRDRFRFAVRLAFTPGPGEWETIPLPRALFPLYRVVRMGRLAKKFAGAFVTS